MPVELATRDIGEGAPVIVMHGLLGQGRNWQAIAKRLTDGRQLSLVDLRNHGASPWASPMTYAAMVEDVLALADRRHWPEVALVGHSMGGKVAMQAALRAPERIAALAVVDVAPVPYRHGQFAAYIDAMRELDLAALGRRSAVEKALEAVDPDPRVRAFLTSNLEVTPERLRWLPNLEALRADLPAILDFPLPAPDASYAGPTLFICGERSDYLKEQEEPLVRRLFPQAAIERVAAAGHWVHADKPEAVIRLLDEFLPRAS
jgi:pimeloyl-ACP methyl ester carboxylesterase